MRIAIMRTGTVLYSDNSNASPVAGNQDVLGILRYLRGRDVCIFGMTSGEFDVPVFNVNMKGLDYLSPGTAFHERIDAAIAELAAWKPDICLNIAGGAPTISDPCNEWGVLSQAWAMRTVLPCLKACHVLDIPRHVVINDPRNYPKDHEMHYWPRAMPASMLSQRERTWTRTVRGREQVCHEVYAGAENWWSYGLEPVEAEREGIIVMAHSHLGDSRIKHRQGLLDSLDNCLDDYDIYGRGWEGNPRWKGVIKQGEVLEVLSRYKCGPMIPIEPDFCTAKLREYALAGVHPLTVWGWERYKPQVIDGHWGVTYDRDYVEYIRQVTTPDFSALEELLAGEPMGGVSWKA